MAASRALSIYLIPLTRGLAIIIDTIYLLLVVQNNQKANYYLPRRPPGHCAGNHRTQDRRHTWPSHLQMGPRERFRRRYDHLEAYSST